MILKELLSNIDILSVKGDISLLDGDVDALCQNSRLAKLGSLFFCIVGAVTDGHKYAVSAYELGARAFVVEQDVSLPDDAIVITVRDSSEALKRLSVIFYGAPSKELRLIGITGTKGKTTVALSVYNIARECGINIGYIGTNGILFCDRVIESANTTPDCLEMQKALRAMVDSGVTDVVIEVSSQALWKERTFGLDFEICAFTNLFEDHIGGVEHPDMEHYMCSKKRLFTDYNARNIVINADCSASQFMIDGAIGARLFKTSAKGDESCDLYVKEIKNAKNGVRPGISFDLYVRDGSDMPCSLRSDRVFIPIPGIYSIENGLLTVAICSLMGIESDMILNMLSRLSIAGRFESILLDSKPETLFVIDYAHNGASLTAVLESLREYEPKRIIALFGSVGDRTFGRRAELGKAAELGADVIIITSDNPNKEDPMSVINDIYAAIEDKSKEIYLIAERENAIKKAYEIAERGDFVLLAGKGHESYQLIDGNKVPFCERSILQELDLLSHSYV